MPSARAFARASASSAPLAPLFVRREHPTVQCAVIDLARLLVDCPLVLGTIQATPNYLLKFEVLSLTQSALVDDGYDLGAAALAQTFHGDYVFASQNIFVSTMESKQCT